MNEEYNVATFGTTPSVLYYRSGRRSESFSWVSRSSKTTPSSIITCMTSGVCLQHARADFLTSHYFFPVSMCLWKTYEGTIFSLGARAPYLRWLVRTGMRVSVLKDAYGVVSSRPTTDASLPLHYFCLSVLLVAFLFVMEPVNVFFCTAFAHRNTDVHTERANVQLLCPRCTSKTGLFLFAKFQEEQQPHFE